MQEKRTECCICEVGSFLRWYSRWLLKGKLKHTDRPFVIWGGFEVKMVKNCSKTFNGKLKCS